MILLNGGKGSDVDVYVSARPEMVFPNFGNGYDAMSEQVGDDHIDISVCVPPGNYSDICLIHSLPIYIYIYIYLSFS